VALARGGALETVIDGENGILYPDTDVASLTAALDRVASTRFDADLVSRSAQRFSRARHVQHLREVIDETVAAPTGARW
jgi:glycosyltransferase involved in cell wall biosynthesis